MTKKMLLGATALQTFAACGLAFAIATPAFAQETAAPPVDEQAPPVPSEVEAQSDTTAAPDEPDAIVVTGSRIRRPNLESTVPITSIGGESVLPAGRHQHRRHAERAAAAAQHLRAAEPGPRHRHRRPQPARPSRPRHRSAPWCWSTAAATSPADILNNAVSPDINTIPNDLIERVDIVTGGNSAIYGSDAIAGVVNFVLRRDFEGLQVRGQAGVSPRRLRRQPVRLGDVRHNFADDRANVTLHGEFAKQDRVFGSDLPWLQPVDGHDHHRRRSGRPAQRQRRLPGRDVPSRHPQRDDPPLRPGPDHASRRHTPAAAGAEQRCDVAPTRLPALPASAAGTPYNCTYIFDAAGNLVAADRHSGWRRASSAASSAATARPAARTSCSRLRRTLKRYNFNLLAHLRSATRSSRSSRPSGTGQTRSATTPARRSSRAPCGQFDARERVRLDNPFLSPRSARRSGTAILASGCNTEPVGGLSRRLAPDGGRHSSGSCPQPALRALADWPQCSRHRRDQRPEPTASWSPAHLLDVGIRDEKFKRDTYRIVGGLRGTFNDDWNYEVSVNYGKFKEDKVTLTASSIGSASCWRWTPGSIRSPGRSSAARSSIRRLRSPTTLALLS